MQIPGEKNRLSIAHKRIGCALQGSGVYHGEIQEVMSLHPVSRIPVLEKIRNFPNNQELREITFP